MVNLELSFELGPRLGIGKNLHAVTQSYHYEANTELLDFFRHSPDQRLGHVPGVPPCFALRWVPRRPWRPYGIAPSRV